MNRWFLTDPPICECLIYYPLLMADIPRIIHTLFRRVGFVRRLRLEEENYGTPWERGFQLNEIRALIENTMQKL